MFNLVQNELARRALALRTFSAHIKAIESNNESVAKACKGLAFVQIYAMYEYTVRMTVQATIQAIRNEGLAVNRLRSELFALVLNPEWDSAGDAGNGRKWEQRIALIRAMNSTDPLSATRDSLFPADGSHYRIRQLYTIWSILGVTDSVVPEPRYIGRIDEMVENRNAIAHGRETPENVGGRYSIQDIEERVADAEAICQHIVDTVLLHREAGGLEAV